MSLRVLHAFGGDAAANPFVDPVAACRAWLPRALNELGAEVAELAAGTWSEVVEAARAFAPDVVHVHGLAAESREIDGVPVVVEGEDAVAGAPRVTHGWWRGGPAQSVAIIPPGIDTDAVPVGRDPGDHLVACFDGRDEHALAAAIAIASSAERPLVLLVHASTEVTPICRAAIEAGQARGWLRVVSPLGAEPPAELVEAAALLSLGRARFDLAAVTAMAVGVPVITLEGCPAAEVVVGGESGFVCRSVADAARALGALEDLRPALGRSRARLLFDISRPARAYLQLYGAMVTGVTTQPVHPEWQPAGHTGNAGAAGRADEPAGATGR